MKNYFCRVFYEDTDAGGIVYYANYFKFIERARTESLRDLGLVQSKLKERYSIIFVVRNVVAEFIKPARLDNLLEITTNYIKVGKLSVEIEQEIFLDSIIIFKAKIKLGIVNITGKPKKLPDDLKGKFEKLSNNSIKISN